MQRKKDLSQVVAKQQTRRGVLYEGRVGQEWRRDVCRKLLRERNVVKKYWRRVLLRGVGEGCCGEVMKV